MFTVHKHVHSTYIGVSFQLLKKRFYITLHSKDILVGDFYVRYCMSVRVVFVIFIILYLLSCIMYEMEFLTGGKE